MGNCNFVATSAMEKRAPDCLALRIQVCPKERNTPTFLFFSDGIGTLNPILGRGLDS